MAKEAEGKVLKEVNQPEPGSASTGGEIKEGACNNVLWLTCNRGLPNRGKMKRRKKKPVEEREILPL